MKRRVVVTGACGEIAGRVLPGLREHFELTLLDIRDTTIDGTQVEGVHRIDLLNDDRTAYRELFRGTMRSSLESERADEHSAFRAQSLWR